MAAAVLEMPAVVATMVEPPVWARVSREQGKVEASPFLALGARWPGQPSGQATAGQFNRTIIEFLVFGMRSSNVFLI